MYHSVIVIICYLQNLTRTLAVAVRRVAPRFASWTKENALSTTEPRAWAVAAGTMLALTFTCRVLLLALVTDTVQSVDKSQVGPAIPV